MEWKIYFQINQIFKSKVQLGYPPTSELESFAAVASGDRKSDQGDSKDFEIFFNFRFAIEIVLSPNKQSEVFFHLRSY